MISMIDDMILFELSINSKSKSALHTRRISTFMYFVGRDWETEQKDERE